MKHLLTVEEAAESLGLGRTKMYEIIATGRLESVRIGKARRIPADALDEYVARLRDEAREPQPAA